MGGARLAAQGSCPSGPTVTIVSPTSLSTVYGVWRVRAALSAPPANWAWDNTGRLDTYTVGGVLIERISMVRSGQSLCCNWDTTLPAYAQGGIKMQATHWLRNLSTGQRCQYGSLMLFGIYPQNPNFGYHLPKAPMAEGDPCDQPKAATRSQTDPYTGAQVFHVPVTSWRSHGRTWPFRLSYLSNLLIDPAQATATGENFSGLSERLSRWTQTYAQWIDVWRDETGKEYAVRHADGNWTAFEKQGTAFVSEDSYESLTWGGGPVSGSTNCGGGGVNVSVPYGWFILKTADGTEFRYNYQPPQGQTHLVWRTGSCAAFPHYLLSSIRTRWGHALTVNWAGERVSSVADETGAGLTFTYVNGLLSTVQDPQGRTHNLAFSAVPDETSTNRQKLTGVTVQGPGSPNRATHTWSFVYRDARNPNLAYGGTYSGDLVIRKTEPDGQVSDYRHEAVDLVNGRPLHEDYHGRISSVRWTDASEGAPVEKVIARTKESASAFRMDYPGGPSFRHTYTGEDLTELRNVVTNRAWSLTWDAKANPLTLRTPLEQSTVSPLLDFQYVFDSGGRIDQATRRVRQASDTLGDPVETQLNDFTLPTQLKAYARVGGGLPDQVTQLQYDGGGPLTVGNLTKVIAAVGTALQEETNRFYDAPDGNWGLATRRQNAVGATSSADYDDTRGWLLSASSPENLVVPVGHPDRAPSVTVLAYNSDQLPSLAQDALGHQVGIGYNAAAPGSANLVITLTFADTSTRQVTIDPMGRILESKDERGIRTLWTYNPQGEVKTVRRAVGTAVETVTTFYYDSRGDLSHFDPPNGSSGRVTFEYVRYNQDGTLQGTYEGQVCRAVYPDGTSEYWGYNDAGELAWHRRADGTLATLERDERHRVTVVHVPASGGHAAFDVTIAYDEFDRVVSSSDNSGTTQSTWDALNRLASLTPPLPQKALVFTHTKDLTLQREIATVNVAGVGDLVQRGDTKGRLSQVVSPFGQTTTVERDKEGKPTLVTLPNGTKEEYGYTARDWLASVQLKKADGSVFDFFNYFYTDSQGNYDPTGHLRREVDSLGQTREWVYNDLYRLIQESHPDFGTLQYGHDANGNRLSRTTSAGTDYYGVDAQNKLLWVNRGTNAPPTSGQANPYTLNTHDLNGRVTRRERKHDGGLTKVFDFLWDGDDRLRSVKEGVTTRFTATYGGDGLRVNKWDSWTGQHDYSWGPGGLVHDSNGSTTYTPRVSHRKDGVDRFYHGDWLGSTRYLSDSTGNSFPTSLRYDGYGQKSASQGPFPPDGPAVRRGVGLPE